MMTMAHPLPGTLTLIRPSAAWPVVRSSCALEPLAVRGGECHGGAQRAASSFAPLLFSLEHGAVIIGQLLRSFI